MEPIFQAEKKGLVEFSQAIMSATKQGLDFQTIERILRAANSQCFLIARDPAPVYTRDMKCIFAGDSTEKKYYLFVSIRPPFLALQEILEESSSYEENFLKLLETGFATKSDDIPLSKQYKYPPGCHLVDLQNRPIT
jgi:hypothetical protein